MSANPMVGPIPLAVKVGEALFQVQRGCDPLQPEPQLDHREGHLRLDPHDDGLRPAEPDHVGDVAQGTGRERIDHVERSDVHDDPPGADLADRQDQRVPQLLQVLVGERGLHRRDQIGALLEDRNLHEPSRRSYSECWVVCSCVSTTLYPSRRSASSMPPWRSPTVFILPRSTPILTRVWAISGDSPVTITFAPRSRAASTVCTRWFATGESM